MKCYRCNNELSNNDYCLKCGADVSVYKIIVKASNTYYNQGLYKAQVRDLSGAVSCLKTSISINKNNIKARNLLGLVYYEMGEIVLALSQWVLSKNIKPERNVADIYINKVQANPNKLDAMNQAVKRYNIALNAAKSGSEDIALIQLKKVITLNPHFVKAGLLLSLIYISKGQKERARKMLIKVLQVDRNNTVALRYLSELDEKAESEDENELTILKKRKRQKNITDTSLSGNDVIVPFNSYKEPSNGVFTVLSILFGVLIGAAMVWYLILPARIATVKQENNKVVLEYNEQLAENSVDMAKLNSYIADIEAERDSLKRELAIYTGDTGQSNMYKMLIEAVDSYVNYQFAETMVLLEKIDVALLPTQNAKNVYSTMMDYCNSGADRFMSQGIKAYKEKDYFTAESFLKAAIIYDGTNDEAAYYLGLCYEDNKDNGMNETERLLNVYEYYQEFLKNYPGSSKVSEVKTRANAIYLILNPPKAEESTQASEDVQQQENQDTQE